MVVEILSDGIVVGVLRLDGLLLQFVHQAAPQYVDVLILFGALLDVVPGVDIYQLSVLRQVAGECQLALMVSSLARTLQVVDGCRTAPICRMMLGDYEFAIFNPSLLINVNILTM